MTTETAAAGLPIKPYKPRCNFGHAHLWVMSEDDEADCQCATCGRVSSAHPAFQLTDEKGTR